MLPILKIDEEFKTIIPPLHRKEYLQLEQNILKEGCLEPISVWDGFIIDGHNRYEICHKHGIHFKVKERYFNNREAVISWICAHQLGRRNITEETRKYLIGRQYEAEKVATRARNSAGRNQYTESTEEDERETHHTAERIAVDNHICYGTVQKYAAYSRALDEIAAKEPKLLEKILSGVFKVSHRTAIDLAHMSVEELQRINRKLDHSNQPFSPFKQSRAVVHRREQAKIEGPSIKDMPAFDPDAEVNSLSLTIPSWASSIDRVRTNTDFSIVTPKGRAGLMQALYILEKSIKDLFFTIEGK